MFIPVTIALGVLIYKTHVRVKRIEKMMLHQEYQNPSTGVTYIPKLQDVPDPDVQKIKQLRAERRRELQEMGRLDE